MTLLEDPPAVADLADSRQDLRWVWTAMEPDERRERLARLEEWIAWLVEEYELRNDILPCWYRHSAALNRLTALYVSWVRIYVETSEQQRDLSQVEWHDALDRTIGKLEYPLACRDNGVHTEPHTAPPTWNTDAEFRMWLGTSPTMISDVQHPAPYFKLRPKVTRTGAK